MTGDAKGRRISLPARLAATVMLPRLTGAQQRLAWSLVSCMSLRKPSIDTDGRRLVFRIERDAIIDLCGLRIDNMGRDLARLMRDARVWAPGHDAHDRPAFETLRYEPGRIGEGQGWVVGHVDGTLKRMLADARVCWIPMTQFRDTKRQVAMAALVKGTGLAWYRDDEDMRPAEGFKIESDKLSMWSERADGNRWAVWARNTLRPAMKELGHVDRIVQFAFAESPGEAVIRARTIDLQTPERGYLTDLTLPKILEWSGADAGRHPSKAGWKRAYAERAERKIERVKLSEREERLARQEAEATKKLAEAQRLMAEVERRERALRGVPTPAVVRPAPSPTRPAIDPAFPLIAPSAGRPKNGRR